MSYIDLTNWYQNHTFVNLTKLESFMFRPHKLQILLLVYPTKIKHTFVNLTKLETLDLTYCE